MSFVRKLLLTYAALGLLLAVGAGFLWRSLVTPAPRPTLPDTYWGPGKPTKDNSAIVPFKVNVSDETLKDLRRRLQSVPTLTPPLEDSNFRYGFNSEFLQEVVAFWLNKYPWRQRETFLNSLPQFTTEVSGLRIHFLHSRPASSSAARSVPILLLHGWPGSVRELYELTPLLTTHRAGQEFVFEVVAPSLPGYGFSQGASKQGMGPAQMGQIFLKLMERLGHKQFFIHGGDWGSAIGSAMATIYPDRVLGFHTTISFQRTLSSTLKLMIGSYFPSLIMDTKYYDRVYPLKEKWFHLIEESGYMHIQATKPDTVSVALRDSPVGLAAYILEKFSTWTNKNWRELPDGGLLKKFSLTTLLDNVMIYWISGSITTSMRLYSEGFSKRDLELNLDRVPSKVPTAIANFMNELIYTPESIVKEKYPNLVHFSHFSSGGHFPALEVPERLADDIWEAVHKIIEFRKRK